MKFSLDSFLESFPFEPFLAVIAGAGIGLLAAKPIQAYLSHLAVERCNASSLHVIVTLDGPLGEQKHCLPRTMIQGPATPLKP